MDLPAASRPTAWIWRQPAAYLGPNGGKRAADRDGREENEYLLVYAAV